MGEHRCDASCAAHTSTLPSARFQPHLRPSLVGAPLSPPATSADLLPCYSSCPVPPSIPPSAHSPLSFCVRSDASACVGVRFQGTVSFCATNGIFVNGAQLVSNTTQLDYSAVISEQAGRIDLLATDVAYLSSLIGGGDQGTSRWCVMHAWRLTCGTGCCVSVPRIVRPRYIALFDPLSSLCLLASPSFFLCRFFFAQVPAMVVTVRYCCANQPVVDRQDNEPSSFRLRDQHAFFVHDNDDAQLG